MRKKHTYVLFFNMTKGYIYCLSNPSFKDNTYKIGYTTKTPELRAYQLYKTGLPKPFQIEFSKYVRNVTYFEKQLHQKFKRQRMNYDREFFRIPLKTIKKSFDEIPGLYNKQKSKKNPKDFTHHISYPSLRRRMLRRKCKGIIYGH